MTPERYSRQSFLGDNSIHLISSRTVGIIGLGGGGSHVVQQLAHVGFRNFVLYDPDYIEESNLNRTVGASEEDVELGIPKVDIAECTILRVHKNASIKSYKQRWQEYPEPLRACDIVFGCVDSYQGKHEIEVSTRRYLIPYIDIGLTVIHFPPRAPVMSGHVFLSMPGRPCMWCLGLLSEKKLSEEAQGYGDTGPQPQVVWANGVLASTAVGIAVDIVTGWTKQSPRAVYLLYRGNHGFLKPHRRLDEVDLNKKCPHHPIEKAGDPKL